MPSSAGITVTRAQSWRNLCPQLCGHKLREMAHIRGRNDASASGTSRVRAWAARSTSQFKLGSRGGRPGLARLGPQATAEPERVSERGR